MLTPGPEAAVAVVVAENRANWTIIGDVDSFEDLVKSLNRRMIPCQVKLQKQLADTDLLTTRQEQIISIAFERGYFDFQEAWAQGARGRDRNQAVDPCGDTPGRAEEGAGGIPREEVAPAPRLPPG